MRRFLSITLTLVLLAAVALAVLHARATAPEDATTTSTASPIESTSDVVLPSPTTDPATPTSSPTPTTAPSLRDPKVPADAVAMVVTYVYDGDTIQARVVKPNDLVTTKNPIRIRLIGIDAPETDPLECYRNSSTKLLRALLPEGSRIWVAPDRDTWDDYQRRLFYVWTKDGTFVPAEQIRDGAAVSLRIWPNVEHTALFDALQAKAERAGTGMWSRCT